MTTECKPKVLVVDDDFSVSRAMAAILRAEGYQVRVAYSGVEGLAAVREWLPDCVLLDVMLPDFPGIEILRTLRDTHHPASDRAVFVLVTAFGRSAEVQEGLALGACACVTKPFDPPELLRVVSRELLASVRHGE